MSKAKGQQDAVVVRTKGKGGKAQDTATKAKGPRPEEKKAQNKLEREEAAQAAGTTAKPEKKAKEPKLPVLRHPNQKLVDAAKVGFVPTHPHPLGLCVQVTCACGNVRFVHTQDAFQITACEACIRAERKTRKKARKAAAKAEAKKAA